MKINRKEVGDTRFVDLDVGDVFTHEGYVYMKLRGKDGNAERIGGNEIDYFEDHELVIPYPSASLNLE